MDGRTTARGRGEPARARILVVEDYAPLRGALLRGLENSGHEPIEASDGARGLEVALGTPMDLVVLDLMLPEIDGMEFLRRFRAAGRTRPVLVLSAKDTHADRVAGLDEGADDYLVKPFAFEEFLARVRALLRRSGPSPLSCVGPLALDISRRTAKVAGRPIDLTAREFALLELLALREGRPLDRASVRSALWDGDEAGESNGVEVLVSHVRRKLEAAGCPGLLRTRRGFGYSLEEAS
jgi:two-component system copper resistance phosphate regulon response regulator CusR